MLDFILVIIALLIALVLRAEPLRRLRALTLPLVLTAIAALAHFVVAAVPLDGGVVRGAEVALVLALGFLLARGCLLLVFEWVLIRRMGVTPPRLMREVLEIDESGLQSLLADRADLAGQLAEKMAVRQLQVEKLRDETGALISPAGLVTQLRKHLLRIVGLAS